MAVTMTRLVISRKPGERIFIGSRLVSIEVAEIDRNKVAICIEAPDDVQIAREEVLDQFFPLNGGKESDDAKSP